MSGQVKMPPIQDASEEIPTPNGARNRMRSSADFPWQSPVRQQARDAMYRSLSEGLEIIAPASSEREFGPFAGKFTVSEAFFEPLLFISPDKPDLDELERQALQREERLRAVASSVASS